MGGGGGETGTYSLTAGWSGSFPAAAIKVKMAMMTRRTAKYFMFACLLRELEFSSLLVGGNFVRGQLEVFMNMDCAAVLCSV